MIHGANTITIHTHFLDHVHLADTDLLELILFAKESASSNSYSKTCFGHFSLGVQ